MTFTAIIIVESIEFRKKERNVLMYIRILCDCKDLGVFCYNNNILSLVIYAGMKVTTLKGGAGGGDDTTFKL